MVVKMLVLFTFKAKAGKEKQFEALLNDPEGGRRVAAALGATRNALFLREGRMARVIEFPDDAKPRSLAEVAKEDPAVLAFLRKLGPLIEDGFDADQPGALDAFNKRVMMPLAYDVRP